MPDTTSITTQDARAAFTAGHLLADLNTGTARIALRRAVLAAPERTPR